MLATSLDGMSDGRFVLGLGAGSPQLAEGLHQVPFARPVDRLATVTREVRRLLDGQQPEPSATGRTRSLQLAVRPAHRIPIQLAALGPRAVRLSGELADSWNPFLLPISGLAGSARLLAEGAARVPGKDHSPDLSRVPIRGLRRSLPGGGAPPGGSPSTSPGWVRSTATRSAGPGSAPKPTSWWPGGPPAAGRPGCPPALRCW